jgi:hypothetical protein
LGPLVAPEHGIALDADLGDLILGAVCFGSILLLVALVVALIGWHFGWWRKRGNDDANFPET